MRYSYIFLLLVLVLMLMLNILLKVYIVQENFDTISKIKTDNAKQDAIDKGFEGGFVETGASVKPLDEQTADRIDYNKALNDFDVEYHDTPEKIARDEGYNLESIVVWVYDPKTKQKVAVSQPIIQKSAIFYEPGAYKYGAATYVPNYTESVLLSASNDFLSETSPRKDTYVTYYDINKSSYVNYDDV